jgi:hypothetical protein
MCSSGDECGRRASGRVELIHAECAMKASIFIRRLVPLVQKYWKKRPSLIRHIECISLNYPPCLSPTTRGNGFLRTWTLGGSRPTLRGRCTRATAKGTHATAVARSSAAHTWSTRPRTKTVAPTACILPVRGCGRLSGTDAVVATERSEERSTGPVRAMANTHQPSGTVSNRQLLPPPGWPSTLVARDDGGELAVHLPWMVTGSRGVDDEGSVSASPRGLTTRASRSPLLRCFRCGSPAVGKTHYSWIIPG